MFQDLTWIVVVVSWIMNLWLHLPCVNHCHSCTVKKKCDVMFCHVGWLAFSFSCSFVKWQEKSYRWGCYVHRDVYLLFFFKFHFCSWICFIAVHRCGCGWMPFVFLLCLPFSLSLCYSSGKIITTCSSFVSVPEDQEDVRAVYTLPGNTLLPCSRLNPVLAFRAETIVVISSG